MIVAPDKFKGSLSAREAAARLAAGLRFGAPGVEVRELPVADGGEGTLQAALAVGFRRVPVCACGPTGEPLQTAYAERDGTAVVELADVSGLGRLPGGRPAPLLASSYGTGQVIAAALQGGADTVIVGVGGSACSDGGAGLLQALGARLLDGDGAQLEGGGGALARLQRVDLDAIDPRVRQARIVVLADVDNPLLGPRGAAPVYGPQKGADAEQVKAIESGLRRLAELLGPELAARPGAGAAGGVAFGAMAGLGAAITPGSPYLLKLLGLPAALVGARLVITGEGALDRQTLSGKAPAGVAALALRAGVPTFAVAGRLDLSAGELRAAGIARAWALSELEPAVERCLREAGRLLERLARERIAPLVARSPTGSAPAAGAQGPGLPTAAHDRRAGQALGARPASGCTPEPPRR